MVFLCNSYPKILFYIIFLLPASLAAQIFFLPANLEAQVVVLDTTMQLNKPLTHSEQLDLNNYLMLAASEGVVVAIDWLLKNGAEIDCITPDSATPLMLAVANNETEAVKALLRYKPDVNVRTTYSETPLLAAVKNGNIDIAETLIRDSAEINIADKYGATPLHYASLFGYFYLADMLLYYNATIDIKSVDGTTPLMAAIWSGNPDLVDLLIQNGASLKDIDNNGFTPLMVAAQKNDTLILSIIIKKGGSLNEVNNFKYDALDVAIRTNKKEAVNFLLKNGYNFNNKDVETIDPYSVAVKYSRRDILQILGKNKVPEYHRFGFDQVAITTSIKFNRYDYFTGLNFSLKEPFLNAGIIAGFDFKPDYTRVLQKVDDYTFYQYFNKSYVAYAGLFKDINLTNHPVRGNWILNSSVVAGYDFGNKMKGTEIVPADQVKIIPSIGIRRAGNKVAVGLNIEYMKTKFYGVGPLWVRFGLTYNIFLDHVRAPGKEIKWN